jgi:hypothetical protein
MKALSFCRYALFASSISFFVACAKEKIQRPPITTPGIITASQPASITLSLVADHWVNNENGNYSNAFPSLLQSMNSDSSTIRSVEVYVLWQNSEYPIIGEIPFLGGTLRKVYDRYDHNNLIIIYHSSNALPFNSLNLKVIIQKN